MYGEVQSRNDAAAHETGDGLFTPAALLPGRRSRPSPLELAWNWSWSAAEGMVFALVVGSLVYQVLPHGTQAWVHGVIAVLLKMAHKLTGLTSR